MKTANLNLLPINFRSKNVLCSILFVAGLLSVSSTLSAADPLQVSIKNAEYDAEKSQLKVEVSLGAKGKKTVSLLNNRTEDPSLAQKTTRAKEVRFKVGGLSGNVVPCEVRVEAQGVSEEPAPGTAGAGNGRERCPGLQRPWHALC
jgi:hypothetical protein